MTRKRLPLRKGAGVLSFSGRDPSGLVRNANRGVGVNGLAIDHERAGLTGGQNDAGRVERRPVTALARERQSHDIRVAGKHCPRQGMVARERVGGETVIRIFETFVGMALVQRRREGTTKSTAAMASLLRSCM